MRKLSFFFFLIAVQFRDIVILMMRVSREVDLEVVFFSSLSSTRLVAITDFRYTLRCYEQNKNMHRSLRFSFFSSLPLSLSLCCVFSSPSTIVACIELTFGIVISGVSHVFLSATHSLIHTYTSLTIEKKTNRSATLSMTTFADFSLARN